MTHHSSLGLTTRQVTRNCLLLQEKPQQNSHDLSLFLDQLVPKEELADGRHPQIVAEVDLSQPEPAAEIVKRKVQLMFSDDGVDQLGSVLESQPNSSKEHPQQIRVGVTAVFLLHLRPF